MKVLIIEIYQYFILILKDYTKKNIMKKIQVTARLKIHEGKFEEFKEWAKECMTSTKSKDTGTLQYDWFLNADQTECVARETYLDSNAVLEHVGNLGEILGRVPEIGDLSLEVYGNPSEELIAATAEMDIVTYSYYQGL